MRRAGHYWFSKVAGRMLPWNQRLFAFDEMLSSHLLKPKLGQDPVWGEELCRFKCEGLGKNGYPFVDGDGGENWQSSIQMFHLSERKMIRIVETKGEINDRDNCLIER
ncbi:hypothetical protein FQR65_LT05663 [Abscondita terminalis]|nr:hypothetical protein FQR65_LT05663 [Abscondita terminalis]